MDAATLEKEALQLPIDERTVLVNRLIASLSATPNPLHQLWVEEVEERMNAYNAGEINAIDGKQALSDLRQQLSQ